MRRRLWLSIVASVLFTACGEVTPDPDPDPEPGPCDEPANLECPSSPTAVTTAEVHELFAARCTDCHEPTCFDAASPDTECASLDLTTEELTQQSVGRESRYATGSSTMKIVDPGNLANSTMWLKILGGEDVGCMGPNGERTLEPMPNPKDGDEPLNAAERQLVKNWICSGAGT